VIGDMPDSGLAFDLASIMTNAAAPFVAVFDGWEFVPPTSGAFAGRKQNPSLHAVGLPTLAKTAQGWGSLVRYDTEEIKILQGLASPLAHPCQISISSEIITNEGAPSLNDAECHQFGVCASIRSTFEREPDYGGYEGADSWLGSGN
jgi:hypothetical protein